MTTQGDTVPLLSVFNHHHRAIAIAALLALLHPTAQGQVTNQKAVGTAGSLPTEFLPRISPQNRNLALSRAGCDRKLEATIIAGLAGLKELQKPDGSWGGLNEYGTAALALMAFYGHGEGQKSSPFLETIRRGIQFLNSSRMSKYIVEMTAKNERVQLFERREWEMAMGAIAMAEHAILSEDASIRDTLSAHTVAILRQQLESGGWGPSATPSIGWKPIDANRKADICRTAWMVQALRASKMAGCAPPEVDAALAKAEQFVRSLSLPKGGFGCRLPEQDYLRSGIGAFVLASNQSAVNLPPLRTLFFEYPDDPGSWLVEDEYMLGANLLVAPLFEDAATSRRVYLPPGTWIDYQSGRSYEGARYHEIAAGTIPIVLLVKNHTVLPHVAVAQNTAAIDWRNVELKVFATDGAASEGTFIQPGGAVQTLRVEGANVVGNPLAGRVTWRVTRPTVTPGSN